MKWKKGSKLVKQIWTDPYYWERVSVHAKQVKPGFTNCQPRGFRNFDLKECCKNSKILVFKVKIFKIYLKMSNFV